MHEPKALTRWTPLRICTVFLIGLQGVWAITGMISILSTPKYLKVFSHSISFYVAFEALLIGLPLLVVFRRTPKFVKVLAVLALLLGVLAALGSLVQWGMGRYWTLLVLDLFTLVSMVLFLIQAAKAPHMD